jgi:outer membrane protein assembly factor BamA
MHRFLLLLFLFPIVVSAQIDNGTKAVIQNIYIEGNKKTKDRIIHRELDFTIGDTISIIDFEERMLLSKKRLYNTGLFNLIEITFKGFNASKAVMDIHITLAENLFIYPAPIFELADRNFNVWWTEQGRSLDRVNYGIRLDHINTTGVQDRFKIKVQFGYTRKYELKYNYPYLNDNWGFGASIFYSEQKEIGHSTIANKTVFFQAEDERILLRRFRVGSELNYRPNFYQFHSLKLEFHRNGIADLVATDLNPQYFLDGSNRIRFFFLEYDFNLNRRVYNIYPEGGYGINFNVKKEGFGIFKDYNNLSVHLDMDKHIPIVDNLVSSFRLKAKTNLIRDQVAFANNTGLGYGADIVGGYELFVVDGTDFVLGETQLKYRFFNKVLNMNMMPLDGFKKLHMQLYLRANLDYGYVNERDYIATNSLNNRWIVGYGPAIDVLLFNNFLLKFEYSFNQLGESALFINTSFGF